MEWTKVTIKTTTFGAEILTGLLFSAGISSAEIIDPQDRVRHLQGISRTWDYADETLMTAESTDALVVFYVTRDEVGDALILDVRGRIASLDFDVADVGALTLSTESANEKSWAHEWKKHFKPLQIGRVVVVPEWERFEPSPGDTMLKIDPGSAFGTGQHQTTHLCILAMQKHVKPGDRILDVGCGSGILSVLGLLLGAESVFACDIDPAGAISATKKNASLNPIDMNKMTVMSGDILSDSDVDFHEAISKHKYDVVVANIVADVIKELAPIAVDLLKAGGLFIASGIISERLDEVLSAFLSSGFIVVGQNELDGWHSVTGKRP